MEVKSRCAWPDAMSRAESNEWAAVGRAVERGGFVFVSRITCLANIVPRRFDSLMSVPSELAYHCAIAKHRRAIRYPDQLGDAVGDDDNATALIAKLSYFDMEPSQ